MAHRIEQLREAGAAGWDDYVRRHARGTLFHSTRWRTVVEDTYRHRGHYLYAAEGDAIVGVLPLFLCGSRLTGRALVALPFAGTQPSICARDPAVEAALGDAAVRLARKLGAGYVELREEEEKPWPWALRRTYVNIRMALAFGLGFGITEWIEGVVRVEFASAGTVMLAALPVIVGTQLLLSALNFDIQNVPRTPLPRLLRDENPVGEPDR